MRLIGFVQLLLFLSVGIVFGQQKFTTHAVKRGETLYSISKKYKVSTEVIMQHNKEITSAESLKPNILLVIPLNEDSKGGSAGQEESSPVDPQPLAFKSHVVKRKETLLEICEQYNISEEQLKRFNMELYAKRPHKGTVLRIPIYAAIQVEEEGQELEFAAHLVQPKETLWSIAHLYAISVDSLAVLNPDLSKETAYVAIGQELRVPRPKGDSLKEQEVVLYESYTVPKAIGLFRISQDYGIPTDSIIALNPEIANAGGLKEGMVLRLPQKNGKSEVVNAENFIFYEVKPKQTLYSLPGKLGISVDSLKMFNPELENGLKAGMVLKLPKQRLEGFEVKNSLILDKINLVDSVNVMNKPKLLFMLPFRLDKIDFENVERTQSQVRRKDIGNALGFYTGAMVALDSIKRLGVSVNAAFFDTQRNLNRVRSYFTDNPSLEVDAIVGPIDPLLVNEVAVRSMGMRVPVVVPYASKNRLAVSNLFFAKPRQEVLGRRILDYVAGIKKEEELIIIADAEHKAARDSIVGRFPEAKTANMSGDGSLHLVDFETKLEADKTYWVFVESGNSELLASVTSILNAKNAEEWYNVRMFTTSFNGAFESDAVSPTHLSNLQFTFASGTKAPKKDSFAKKYNERFGYFPDRYAVTGFDVTLDVLLKLAYKENLFKASQYVGQTDYSGNRFNYLDYNNMGHFNMASYLLKYKNLSIVELKEDDVKDNL